MFFALTLVFVCAQYVNLVRREKVEFDIFSFVFARIDIYSREFWSFACDFEYVFIIYVARLILFVYCVIGDSANIKERIISIII